MKASVHVCTHQHTDMEARRHTFVTPAVPHLVLILRQGVSLV